MGKIKAMMATAYATLMDGAGYDKNKTSYELRKNPNKLTNKPYSISNNNSPIEEQYKLEKK